MDSERMKRKRFCQFYLMLGNGVEAARLAGYPPEAAAETAGKLLESAACRRYFAHAATHQPVPLSSLVIAGLQRLAFGSVNDAAALVFSEEPLSRAQLAQLDLFPVQELKRDKGGGVEVRFFDRQRALERLLDCADAAESASAATALLDALGGAPNPTTGGETQNAADTLLPETENCAELVAQSEDC